MDKAREILEKHRQKDDSLSHWVTVKHAIEAMEEYAKYKQEESGTKPNKIVSKDSFRSKPLVNQNDDMYRIKLDIEKRNYYRLLDFIDKLNG